MIWRSVSRDFRWNIDPAEVRISPPGSTSHKTHQIWGTLLLDGRTIKVKNWTGRDTILSSYSHRDDLYVVKFCYTACLLTIPWSVWSWSLMNPGCSSVTVKSLIGKKPSKNKNNPYWQWIQSKAFLLNCVLSWLLERRNNSWRNLPLSINWDNEVTVTCPCLKWCVSLQSGYGRWNKTVTWM